MKNKDLKNSSRRDFIKLSALAGAAMVLPIDVFSSSLERETIEIGLIADIHKDIMYDADSRLQAFIDAANKRNPDFIIQMGDFCIPHERNNGFMNIWNTYQGDKYHVLGNHDTDGGYTQKQTRAFWNMPANYYSFDKKGVHFVVLDGNNDTSKAEFYIEKEQQIWLKEDLKNTTKPTIIFCHQSLELEHNGIKNFKDIVQILEKANEEAGFQKVLCCLSGHHHTDYMTQINNIYYVQINSASYRWVGGKYKTIRYSEDLDKKHPTIKYTIPYKDPLFTFMKIKKNKIIIECKKSKFVGPGPEELGMPKTAENNPITARISGFKMKI